MSRSSGEHPLNLKHRITGAVILIGLAVAVVSLLLRDTGEERFTEVRPDKASETFVSRITSTEEQGGQARAPAPEVPPASPREPTPESGGDDPEPAVFKPVLKLESRLPKPPSLNTVDANDQRDTPPARVEPMKPAKPETPAPSGAWVLRVGAFAEKANADSIVTKLKEGGFKPSSGNVEVNGKVMVRVWVGPYAERKDAIRAKTEISRTIGLNGFVVRQN